MSISFAEQAKIEVYKAHRAEIDRRSNVQHAIVGSELLAVTTLTAVALSRANNVGVLLIVPLVSLFLAMQWYDHRLTIRSLGDQIGDLGAPLSTWEEKGKGKPAAWGKYWGLLATLGIFPAASGGAVAALLVAKLGGVSTPYWAILWWLIDLVATAIQIVMVRHLSVNTGSRPQDSATRAVITAALSVWRPRDGGPGV
ncbi:hypothetical protein [Streptomyces lavendulocolor]|uniref:hypothetical protein n=1 Tax=Streptomyces lavendulocolor TaxID=67316 RepID=UPI003403FC25